MIGAKENKKLKCCEWCKKYYESNSFDPYGFCSPKCESEARGDDKFMKHYLKKVEEFKSCESTYYLILFLFAPFIVLYLFTDVFTYSKDSYFAGTWVVWLISFLPILNWIFLVTVVVYLFLVGNILKGVLSIVSIIILIYFISDVAQKSCGPSEED